MKKIVSLLLAVAMLFALAACTDSGDQNTSSPSPGQSTPPSGSGSGTSAPPSGSGSGDEPGGDEPAVYTGLDWAAISAMDHDDQSEIIYDWNLSDFDAYYAVAKAEVEDMDMRLALMALAEGKLMESAVMMPIYGDGGAYAMNRVVPRTASTVLWGLDEYKWSSMLVANELLKSTDRDAIIGMWGEAADADEFFTQVRKYLSDNGFTLNDTYNAATSYDIETWDVIATSYTSDSFFLACTYSGLLEYDAKNVAQPAVAKSYDVSPDGTVYTFHLRDDVQWVDQQGRFVANVTANDWVTSMMHVADNHDELGYLMSSDGGCAIKNYDAYVEGEVPFSEVGVKAIDDYTLEYTLEAKFPFFPTMMGYGCFAPLNHDFYKSQGGTFGAEGDEYTAGNYGTGPDTIAYCGAYLVTNYTAQNVYSYAANPSYYNAGAVNTHYLNFYYNDGTDVLRTYNEAKAGTIAGCSFNTNSLPLARSESPDGETQSYYDLYHYVTTNSATCYTAWLNLNRRAYANANDATQGISSMIDNTEAQDRTRAAMNNHHFRLALSYAFDRGAYNAQQVGEELKLNSLKNSYTPGTFLALNSDVTVDINGTATTFPAGTMYGAIMQAQIDADGYPIKVWDATADGGAGNGDGFDGWFNAANAVDELNKAIDELAQIGIEISAENPIYIDAFCNPNSQTQLNSKNAYKQSIENTLGGKVIVNIVEYPDNLTMQYAYYRTSNGAESNYDISHNSGWGPDYGDAQSYLDTVQKYGYMMKNMGLY